MRFFGKVLFGSVVAFAALAGCSSSNSIKSNIDGGTTTGGCSTPPTVSADSSSFCASCSFPSGADPTTCSAARNVNACCAWVQEPTKELAASTGLHNFSIADSTYKPTLGCLTAAPSAGTPQTVTLKGFLKLFSSGADSAGVKIEIFKEGQNGALGDPVGTAVATSNDDMMDPPQMPLVTWLNKCPPEGCKFRSFTYANVPTETPLIIKTSDATASGTWADLYDYNIYFANGSVDPGTMTVKYDPSALAATDIGVVAATVGATIKMGKGLIAGEVHDCIVPKPGDYAQEVRLSGAMVDSDQPHDSQMFYFTDNESDPLPDLNNKSGTSRLGLFGAINFPTGVPIRLSAVGKYNGADVLLGTYIVQTFPGAVTALSFRGRRPSQK
jgi:hypothetical protein